MSRRTKKNSPQKNRDLSRSEQSMPGARNSYIVLIVCVFLVSAVFLVFSQTLRHGFIDYDDNQYVYKNPQVKHGLTARGIAWALTANHASNWHPLTWLSHMLDCQLYGLNPGGHHLTNLLLHATVAILLFLLLRRMTGDLWPSALVAAVFAIHPLRVESVAWVAERKDVLSGLFFLLTLWVYVGYVRRPFSWARYLLVIALFVLGLMAKPMLVTLPLVLLLLDYWPLGRMGLADNEKNRVYGRGLWGSLSILPRLVMEKIPLLALSGVSSALTVWAQKDAIASNEYISMSLRIANAAVSYATYLVKIFYPANLAVLYPHPDSWLGLPLWKVVGALLLLASITGGVVIFRRRYPYLPTGWFWYLVMLVPVIGLVQVGLQAMADRYTYLPQIGLYIALAWGVADLSKSWQYRRAICGVVSAAVLAVLMGCAWRQTSYWRDEQTLWTHTMSCTSRNYAAHYNLGNMYNNAGLVQEGIKQYRLSLQVKPDYAAANNNLGYALVKMGKPKEAMEYFQVALRLKPEDAEFHNNLANALKALGQNQQAIEHYQRALQINPDYAEAHNNLGIALVDKGQYQQAIEHYQKAFQIESDSPEILNNLGNVFKMQGEYPQAIEHYQRALQLRPNSPELHNNLGGTLLKVNKASEAIEHLRRALELYPNFATAHNNLGSALEVMGEYPRAVEQYQEALRIQPDYLNACHNLALIHAKLKRSTEAIAWGQKALDIARSKGQSAAAKQIEEWLNAYRAGLSN